MLLIIKFSETEIAFLLYVLFGNAYIGSEGIGHSRSTYMLDHLPSSVKFPRPPQPASIAVYWLAFNTLII